MAAQGIYRDAASARIELGRSVLEDLLNRPDRDYVLAIDGVLTAEELRALAIVTVATLDPRSSMHLSALRERLEDG